MSTLQYCRWPFPDARFAPTDKDAKQHRYERANTYDNGKDYLQRCPSWLCPSNSYKGSDRNGMEQRSELNALARALSSMKVELLDTLAKAQEGMSRFLSVLAVIFRELF